MNAVVADAWHLIVPSADDRHGPLAPLLLALTVLTGIVDAFSYLAIGHVFVANMTGNIVFLAFALAGASGFSVAASILALIAFVCGAFAGGRLIAELGAHRGRLLTLVSTVQAAFVAAAMIIGVTRAQSAIGTGSVHYTLIVLLGLAMGLQNAAARQLAVPDLPTTVLTLTITGIFADAEPVGGSGSRIGRRAFPAVAMFLGALTGGRLVVDGRASLCLAIAFVLLAGVATAAAFVSRGMPSWAYAE